MAVNLAEKASLPEPIAPKYDVVAKKPSELFVRNAIGRISFFIPDPALEALVTRGYGISTTFGPTYDKFLEEQYGGEDDKRQIYIAYEGQKAVGLLTFNLWGITHPFWHNLRQMENGVFGGLQRLSPLAVEVGGAVTLPENRGKGVQSALWARAMLELHPSVVLGETKNPDAVVSRAKNLAGHGFETYFGNSEVTPGHETFASLHHHSIRDAYLSAKGHNVDNKGNLVVSPTDQMSTAVPDVSHSSPHIKAAFNRIVDLQKMQNSIVGERKVAINTLISVDTRFHNHPLRNTAA